MDKIVLADEVYRIEGACFEVYNGMGCGFLASVYQECLEWELGLQQIPFAATHKKVGVLVNFGHPPGLQWERFVYKQK